jgi:hypothetical protein
MLLTILLAALQLVPAAPTTGQAELRPYVAGFGAGPNCQRATVRHAGQSKTLRPRRFNELPAGRLELAVMREVDGCPIPAVVREGLGGPPAARN